MPKKEDLTNQELLQFLNTSFSHLEDKICSLEDKMVTKKDLKIEIAKIEFKLIKIKSKMVTKPYLDEKLVSFKLEPFAQIN